MELQQKILTSISTLNVTTSNFLDEHDTLNKEHKQNVLTAPNSELDQQIDKALPALKKAHNILKKAKSRRARMAAVDERKQVLVKSKLFAKKKMELKHIRKQIPESGLPMLCDLKRDASVVIEEEKDAQGELPEPHVIKRGFCCYICNNRYNAIHHFYPRMCPKCGDFNYAKGLRLAI